MRAFLFLVAIAAFYLGVNYYYFNESAIERWAKKTQFPNIESAEVMCSMLTPTTKIEFSYVINNRQTHYLPATAESLCDYYKKQAIPGAKPHNQRLSYKVTAHQRNESLPFNRGKSSLDIQIGYKNEIVRKLDIELKRGFLGDFTIESIKGHDIITREEKPRIRH